ncbi:DUF2474 domain-containing protein [Phytobacter sp. V91]
MQQSPGYRLLWLAILWGGSVMSLALVGLLFRLLMAWAGFKAH